MFAQISNNPAKECIAKVLTNKDLLFHIEERFLKTIYLNRQLYAKICFLKLNV